YESESLSRRVVPLGGRSGFRQLLRALPWSEEMGMGDVLARGRFFQLDHRSLVFCPAHDSGSLAGTPGNSGSGYFLDFFLRTSLGNRRPHLWLDDALLGSVAGDGRGAGSVRRLRNADPPDFPR